MLLRRYTVTIGLLAAVVLSVACADTSGDGSRDFSDVRLVIRQPDGFLEPQESFDAIQRETPFVIIVPEGDPAGTSLMQVMLDPAYESEGEARDRNTMVEMTFVTPEEDGAVILTQILANISTGGEQEAVDLGGVAGTGTLHRSEGGGPAISWKQCEVGMLLSSSPGVLSEDEAIDFAKTMNFGCRVP